MSGKVGRPHVPGSERRWKYAKQFNLRWHLVHKLREAELDQLDKCASDVERRILLGVSHKEAA